ncbi:cytochrome P450 monooxygenase pc-1 [Mycena metata]|uniref:Cytochrome P450 monooxygenase pc-1 n=1 Tax=Mycena metata TaxID=1033252 RepID=A0AAD7P1K9_9AGAR|nr:cytochrome P450 monooxygenase pc-1 [Mycena metata]
MIAPGVVYLGRNALTFGVPLACTAIVVRQFATATWGIFIPTWILVSVSCASVPLLGALRLTLKHFRHQREAAALGARLAPISLRGKWPGNLDLVMEFQRIVETGYPGDGLREVTEEIGPAVNLKPLWADIIFTTEPAHIKLILATDFNNYVKGERFQFGMSSVLGTGVFNSDGEMWKFHRALSRPFFSRDRISHFDIFDRHADEVIALLKERMKTGYAVDFQDLIGRFTMDSATEFLFGSCVNSLHAALPFPHNATFTTPESVSARAQVAMEFSAAFNESMLRIANRARIGWAWPLLEMWSDKTIEPMKLVSAYIDPIIHEAIEKKKLSNSLGSTSEKVDDEVIEGATLLDELLNVTSDPKVLKDETLNILLAGKDTTQWMTTVIVYFLAMYPKVNARLREEILEHVGPDRRPTYDDIRDMKFLRAVINEALRLYPSVPINVRECINATTWPSPNPNEKPIYIPAGTQVPYSVLLMQRRKDLWGPDAEEFDPDRWLDERLKTYLLADSFKFLPFNGGPRLCLGQQFAYNEMSFVIIRLLQSFSSFSLDLDAFPPGSLPPQEWAGLEGRKAMDKIHPKFHLTMYSKGGLWLKMTEA